jgi:hypothetical protein
VAQLGDLHESAQRAAFGALNYLDGAAEDIIRANHDVGFLLDALRSIHAAKDHLQKVYAGSLSKFEATVTP